MQALQSALPIQPCSSNNTGTRTNLSVIKKALQLQIAILGETDPHLASKLSRRVILCNWSNKEIVELQNLGLAINREICPDIGLLGGGPSELLVDVIRGAIYIALKGNKDSMERELERRVVKATFTLPDGYVEEGTHEGGRVLGEPERNRFGFNPQYTLLAAGQGKFTSARITYIGVFHNNLFHDLTGEAQYYILDQLRYTGCFKEGKRSGVGRLEKYDLQTKKFYLYFDGIWLDDKPHEGTTYTPDGATITIKDGLITNVTSPNPNLRLADEATKKPQFADEQEAALKEQQAQKRAQEEQLAAEREKAQKVAQQKLADEQEAALKEQQAQKRAQEEQLAVEREKAQKIAHQKLADEQEAALKEQQAQKRAQEKQLAAEQEKAQKLAAEQEAIFKEQQAQKKAQEEQLAQPKLQTIGGEKIQKVEQQQQLDIPAMAFGPAEWEKYYGTVDPAPPLPADIEQILNSTCPYWPDKKVRETHLLTYVPATVNGMPLTLDLLEKLIQHPKSDGHPTKYDTYNKDVKKEFGGKAMESHWILMANNLIPNSFSKSFEVQCNLMQASYQVPTLVETAVSVLSNYVRTGNMMPLAYKYTRCEENLGKSAQTSFRGFEYPSGVQFCSPFWSGNAKRGLAPLRKF